MTAQDICFLFIEEDQPKPLMCNEAIGLDLQQLQALMVSGMR